MSFENSAPNFEETLPCRPDEVDDFLARPSEAVIEVIRRTPGPFLVLGAGGKMGLHLSLMLRGALAHVDRRDEVIAVSRFSTLRDRDDFERRGVKTIACDLTDEDGLGKLPAAPTVFFMAGVKFGTAAAPELLQKINSEMPRKVAQRFCRSRIVAYSTGCVYPFVTPESGGSTEEMPPQPPGEYAMSCLERERAFNEASRLHGTAATLIRLNYSVEFRYGVLVDIAQKILAGQPVDVSMGYVNVIWQTDAIAHSIQALDVAASPAVPINVTGREILSVRSLAQVFGKLLQRPAQVTGREVPTAWLNNAAKAHRLFGPPATSVDTMTQWIAAWLVKIGQTWGKPTGFEKRDGKF